MILRRAIRRHRRLDAARHHRPAARARLPGRGRDGAQPDHQGQGARRSPRRSRARRPRRSLSAGRPPERFINPLLVMITILPDRAGDPHHDPGRLAVRPDRCRRRLRPQRHRVLRAGRGAAQDVGRAPLRAGRAHDGAPTLALVLVPAAAADRPAALIGLTNVLLPGKGLKQGPFVSEQELLGIVEAAAEDEVIEHEERELIESIIEFGDTVAREIMVPRPDMVTLNATDTSARALDIAIEHGFSRFPVMGENARRGARHRLHQGPHAGRARGPRRPAGGRLSPRSARFVPETKPVARLMREMQAGQVPHGDRRRRVRRHRRPRHAGGLHRGAGRRHRRRVRRGGQPRWSAWPTASCRVDGGLSHRRAQRAARPRPARRRLGHRRRLRVRHPRPRARARARASTTTATASPSSSWRAGASPAVRVDDVPRAGSPTEPTPGAAVTA